MSGLPPQPTKTSGRIILVAHITAKDGEEAKVQSMLADIRKLSESDKEKETYTYRTSRLEGAKNKFIVWEEYGLPDGVKAHMMADPFQKLAASGTIADLDIKYYEEFDGDNKFTS